MINERIISMNYRKFRPKQHIMENTSIQLIKWVLPKEWVIQEYTPDYGIDLRIEIFEDIKGNGIEALGEFVLAQVKSVGKTNIEKIQIRTRENIAKGPLSYTSDKVEEIEVFKYSLDTSTILTIQSMGAAVPVFLLYVTLDTQRVFFINLTDYIDKILIPEDPNFINKKSKTLFIPVKNEINSEPVNFFPLRFSAIRMKFYAFFHKANYQKTMIIDNLYEDTIEGLLQCFEQVLFLLNDIKSKDIWKYINYWDGLKSCYKGMDSLYLSLEKVLNNTPANCCETDLTIIIQNIKSQWGSFVNLGNIYEELIREQHLPSVLANLLED